MPLDFSRLNSISKNAPVDRKPTFPLEEDKPQRNTAEITALEWDIAMGFSAWNKQGDELFLKAMRLLALLCPEEEQFLVGMNKKIQEYYGTGASILK